MCIHILSDWVELGTIAALFLVIYQIRSGKKWRREDFQGAEKRHRQDLESIQQQAIELHVIAKSSTDTVAVLTKLLTTISDQQLSETDRRKREAELQQEQHRLEIRPFFTFKMGGTGADGWNLLLINQGAGAKELTAKSTSDHSVIRKIEFPYNFSASVQSARVLGRVTTAQLGTREQGETPFSLTIFFKDVEGNAYEQTVSFDRGAYDAPTVGDPIYKAPQPTNWLAKN